MKALSRARFDLTMRIYLSEKAFERTVDISNNSIIFSSRDVVSHHESGNIPLTLSQHLKPVVNVQQALTLSQHLKPAVIVQQA